MQQCLKQHLQQKKGSAHSDSIYTSLVEEPRGLERCKLILFFTRRTVNVIIIKIFLLVHLCLFSFHITQLHYNDLIWCSSRSLCSSDKIACQWECLSFVSHVVLQNIEAQTWWT